MKTLRDQFGKPVLFHWVGWHAKDGVSLTGYDSRDPNVISSQLDAMQDLGGDGAGVVALTYGPTVSSFIHQAVMAMCQQCNSRKMPFALCFDPWTVKDSTGKILPSPAKENAMIAALQHPDTQFMLNSRSYLPSKPVLDFNTTVLTSAVTAAVPGIQYWLQNIDYAWIYPTNPAQTPIANKLPTMKLPFVAVQFNDGTGKDRNKQVWDQTKPVRLLDARAGNCFHDMMDSAATCTQAQYYQVGPWNDVSEGTDIEKWASMVGGRIV